MLFVLHVNVKGHDGILWIELNIYIEGQDTIRRGLPN